MAGSSDKSARWTEELHKIFVELCANEVTKANRSGKSLTREGWNTVEQGMKKPGCEYSLRQLKNHWDAMKGDYKIFKKIKFNETGLGWNESTKMIEAPPDWWKQKIEADPKLGKFRNKDLSLYMTYYDTLFGDSVATGERQKAPTSYSAVDLEDGDEYNAMADGEDDGKEGSGDSDEAMPPPTGLFPSVSYKSGKSSGSKRKRSGVECMREGIDILVAAMFSRSTSSTAANEDLSQKEAIRMLEAMEEIEKPSELYFFARRYVLDSRNRMLFLNSSSNEMRYQELLWNFNVYKKNQ